MTSNTDILQKMLNEPQSQATNPTLCYPKLTRIVIKNGIFDFNMHEIIQKHACSVSEVYNFQYECIVR